MLSSKIKDIKIRKLFFKVEKLKKINKFVFTYLFNKSFFSNSNFFPFRNRFFLHFLKNKQNFSKRSKVKITNRCVLNNRNRSIYRPFGISRIVIRNLLHFGVLPGYSKAVW